MLVLTRRSEEALVIRVGVPGGEEPIVVTVLGIEGDRVKLGIAAPRHVTVLRQELCEAVREQNLAAARTRAAEAESGALEALRRLSPISLREAADLATDAGAT
jgi:carbon storage regulator